VTPFCTYELVEFPGRGWMATAYTEAHTHRVGRRLSSGRIGTTREQAEAAAQADFDTRVRGCVEWPDIRNTTPAPSSGSTPPARRPKP
jgi:hypothetical protein